MTVYINKSGSFSQVQMITLIIIITELPFKRVKNFIHAWICTAKDLKGSTVAFEQSWDLNFCCSSRDLWILKRSYLSPSTILVTGESEMVLCSYPEKPKNIKVDLL